MTLTDHIECIAQKTKASKLEKTKLRSVATDIQTLATFLNCTETQAMLFSIIFFHTLESSNADFNDMAGHFDLPVMSLLKFKNDLDQLEKKRLIRKQDNSIPFMRSGSITYYVHSSVIDGILKKRISEGSDSINTSVDFIIMLAKEIEAAEDEHRSYHYLKEDFQSLCRQYENLHIAKKLTRSDIPEHEKLILLLLIYKLMNGEENISLSDACDFLQHDKSFQLRVRRSLMKGESEISRRGLIDQIPGMFRNESDLNITDKGLYFLLGEEAEQFALKSEKIKNEILPAQIPAVKLFMNPHEQEQIATIRGILEQANFDMVTTRMKERNMKAGFTVLLYGMPGTGKTESAYQLARQTGRSVLPVEISHTKSMWFGESEKLIKNVFERYRRLSQENSTAPILLFNEADGIFGKRTTQMHSSVSQTLNAMQNIILQEMEDFEGILMATTNLTDNLDAAFDRRFLYKIKFEVPNPATRRQIMGEKIPFLPPEAIGHLCEQYKLTGGQLANIAKKCSIHELLQGSLPDPGKVSEFCREELGLKEMAKLGF